MRQASSRSLPSRFRSIGNRKRGGAGQRRLATRRLAVPVLHDWERHIDAPWLWPWPEAMAVVNSTFRAALDRMNEHPDFTFTAGRLRPGLSESKAADIIWSMNSPEFYGLWVEQRG